MVMDPETASETLGIDFIVTWLITRKYYIIQLSLSLFTEVFFPAA
jgi:hypothetical protein